MSAFSYLHGETICTCQNATHTFKGSNQVNYETLYMLAPQNRSILIDLNKLMSPFLADWDTFELSATLCLGCQMLPSAYNSKWVIDGSVQHEGNLLCSPQILHFVLLISPSSPLSSTECLWWRMSLWIPHGCSSSCCLVFRPLVLFTYQHFAQHVKLRR